MMHYGRRMLRVAAMPVFSGCAGALILSAMLPQVAYAQEAPGSVTVDVGAGSLEAGLTRFASQSGYQLLFSSALVEGKATAGVQGIMPAQEALARLLAGSGLTFRVLDGKIIQIEAASAAGDGERVLGAVRVQGAQGSSLSGSTPVNGVNGSRDVTATEGTGSYTSNALTVGSKTAQTIKDTAMAVSVITSQQIQDQNITDLAGVMRNAPGVTLTFGGGSNNPQFNSRGFNITQIQIDGGAAQHFGGSLNVNYYRPLIDMSLYDHAELVRGATGTFNGYGDPGGVINLVRKRPLDHTQMLFEMQLGAWDWHRVSADVTGPLAFDGSLRGRLIATHQDNNFFYRTARSNINLVSGTLEMDVTPTTLVTAGVNYQVQNDIPWYVGLPRYYTGKLIPVSRSTCFCFDWANDDRTNLEVFGQIEQKIGSNWKLKVKATRISQDSDRKFATVLGGGINPADGLGLGVGANTEYVGRVRQKQLEVTFDGGFRLFGQNQKIIIGANYSMVNPSGSTNYDTLYPQSPFTNGAQNDGDAGPVLSFNPADWQLGPAAYSFHSGGVEFGDERYLTAYASFEITPISRLHFTGAIRYSGYRTRDLGYGFCVEQVINESYCVGKSINSKFYYAAGRVFKGSSFSWPPSIQGRYDLTANLTFYGAYTDIYIDRSFRLTRDGGHLPPTTGGNFETGLKWLSPNKKLNVTLSAYYTKQINTDFDLDPSSADVSPSHNVGQLNDVVRCCYKNADGSYNLSYGADLEVTGEIRRGLQIAASYTYNINQAKRRGASNGGVGNVYFDGSTQALESRAPRHQFKLWSSYDFATESVFSGVRLGLGVTARSKTFVADSYCPEPFAVATDGSFQCPVSYKPVFFTDPGYVVFSGSLGYRINNNLRLDVEAENLFDKKYLQQVGGLSQGNWYGTPRSVKATIRAKL